MRWNLLGMSETTLICIKWLIPITGRHMWQEVPKAELLARAFLAGTCAEGHMKDESGIWHRDSFQKRSFLQVQGQSPDKGRWRTGNFAGETGGVSMLLSFWKKLPGHDNL